MNGTIYFDHQLQGGGVVLQDSHPKGHPFFQQIMGDDPFTEIGSIILDGQTPDTDLSTLASLSKLKFVSLAADAVNAQNLQDLSECTQSINLDFYRARLFASRIKHLRSMDIPFLQLTECSPLDAEEVKELGKLKSVEHLALMRTPIIEGWEHLHALENLRILALDRTGISDNDLSSICRFEHLETLAIFGDRADAAAVGLRDESTKVKATQLSDGVSHFARLPSLRKLTLNNCDLTDEAVQSLGKLMELEVLHLTFSPLMDSQLRFLANMSRLRELSISGNVSETAARKLHALIPHCRIALFREDGTSDFQLNPALDDRTSN